MEMIKDLEYYLGLDYDIVVRDLDENEGGGFLAYFVDMPFIMGDGETKEEAIKDVKSAFEMYIVSALKHNDRIVEPKHQTMAKRLNITIPNYLLEKIDAYTKNHNITRSAFIQQASKQLLQMQS
jgi:predicted RNase H-like HicB family nuclease